MKNFAVPSANAQAKRRHVPVAKFHTIFGEPSHISYMVMQALSIITVPLSQHSSQVYRQRGRAVPELAEGTFK